MMRKLANLEISPKEARAENLFATARQITMGSEGFRIPLNWYFTTDSNTIRNLKLLKVLKSLYKSWKCRTCSIILDVLKVDRSMIVRYLTSFSITLIQPISLTENIEESPQIHDVNVYDLFILTFVIRMVQINIFMIT